MASTQRAPATGRGEWRLGWLWLPLVLCGAFLYVPILVLVGMSFNDGGSAYTWDGFSLRW